MGVTLPDVVSNQVCIFLIIVFAPAVFYVSGLHIWTHLRACECALLSFVYAVG